MADVEINDIANQEEAKRQADFDASPSRNKYAWFARQIGLYQPFQERFPDMCASRTTVTVLISTGGRANKKGGASYFVVDGKNSKPGWKEYAKFSRSLSENHHDHTAIVVNGLIYLAGGTEIKQGWRKTRRRCSTYFWTFSMDPRIAGWRWAPKMLVARRKFAMAYLKPHLYVIGGMRHKKVIDNVERFDIADYKWEVMPPMPRQCQNLSVVVCQSMLLVYGSYQKAPVLPLGNETYTIQVFDTKMKKWFGAGFTEELNCSGTHMKPAIMEHEGRYLYRVIFGKASQSSADGETAENSAAESSDDGKNGSGDNKSKVPDNGTLVQELIQDVQDGRFVAKMEEAIEQSDIPPNKVGAFRIGDDVFINASGYIHKTGLKVSSFADGNVDLGPWKLVNIDATGIDKSEDNLRDSVTCLTYDTQITKSVWRF
ncbi:uncharacterized protein [Amphiura filiformis]|uniref:uncharacterized protein n=1 Tax=Amphiura filiformis TaxID=82378 RepID=UPI003B214A62